MAIDFNPAEFCGQWMWVVIGLIIFRAFLPELRRWVLPLVDFITGRPPKYNTSYQARSSAERCRYDLLSTLSKTPWKKKTVFVADGQRQARYGKLTGAMDAGEGYTLVRWKRGRLRRATVAITESYRLTGRHCKYMILHASGIELVEGWGLVVPVPGEMGPKELVELDYETWEDYIIDRKRKMLQALNAAFAVRNTAFTYGERGRQEDISYNREDRIPDNVKEIRQPRPTLTSSLTNEKEEIIEVQ